MSSAAYYPAGAYNDPSAPYNEPETPELDFEIEVQSILSRKAIVTSKEYDYDYRQAYFTGDVVKAFKEDSYTIQDLLNVLSNYLIADLDTETDEIKKQHLRFLLNECQAWELTEEEIESA